MSEIIKISIDDTSVTIPKNNGQVYDPILAFELALELYGWHRDTIHDAILQRAEEITENRDND